MNFEPFFGLWLYQGMHFILNRLGCEKLSNYIRNTMKFHNWVHVNFHEDNYSKFEKNAFLDLKWCQHLAKLLKPSGILVFNIGQPLQMLDLALLNDSALRQQFAHAIAFRIAGHLNCMVAVSESPFKKTYLVIN